MTIEDRTARLTLLIDPQKKAVFEYLCAREDQTSSQVVRQMIREYIEKRLGRPWRPGETLKEALKELNAKVPAESPARDSKGDRR